MHLQRPMSNCTCTPPLTLAFFPSPTVKSLNVQCSPTPTPKLMGLSPWSQLLVLFEEAGEPLGMTGVFNLRPLGCILSRIDVHVAQHKTQDLKHYELFKE